MFTNRKRAWCKTRDHSTAFPHPRRQSVCWSSVCKGMHSSCIWTKRIFLQYRASSHAHLSDIYSVMFPASRKCVVRRNSGIPRERDRRSPRAYPSAIILQWSSPTGQTRDHFIALIRSFADNNARSASVWQFRHDVVVVALRRSYSAEI
jgi:hypothetical protein